MIDNPEQDKDLQVLDTRLRDRNASLTIFQLDQTWDNRYAVELLQGKREGGPADDFNKQAEGLVTKAGGGIHLHYGQIGFAASFPTDAARTDFLRSFAEAARGLPAETNGIREVPYVGGWKLGAYGH